MAKYLIADLNSTPGTACPCGIARRAFATPDNKVATLHITDIDANAQTHYHKHMTEIYLVLEGTGHMELDGELVPIRPMTAIMIQPGCRHRAVVAPGERMRIVNIPVPAFDESDEFFD